MPEGKLDELSPAEGYARTLHEMAAILEEQPPAQATKRLRAYIQEHRSIIERIVTELEQGALQLEGEERQAYIRDAHPGVREAMKRFAEAQLRFRDRASEAQKIELQEVLDALQ